MSNQPFDLIHRERGEEGQALLVALVLLVIAFTFAVSLIFFHTEEAKSTIFHRKVAKDRQLALTGVELTLQKLNTDETFANQVENLTTGQMNPFDANPAPGQIAFEGGKITVVIEPVN